MSKKAIIYARYSPRPKKAGEDDDKSNQQQVAMCREYCEANGYDVVGTFTDARKSGDDIDRIGLWDAIEALPRNGVLVCWRYDRLARSVYLGESIRRVVREKKGHIETVSGMVQGNDPEAVLLRQMLDALAEYEKKVASIRTKHAKRIQAQMGRKTGRYLPYGYDSDPIDPKRVVVNPAEQEIIDTMFQWREEGCGYRAIVDRLEEEGIPTKTGKKWQLSIVYKILKREEMQREM
jgi:site-specific DNA recombinase